MSDKLEKAKRLATLAWVYSIVEEADRRSVAKIKEMFSIYGERLDVSVGAEIFRTKILEVIKECKDEEKENDRS